MPGRVTSEMIAALARMAELEIPEADRVTVAAVLTQQLEGIRRLAALDLATVEVETRFDPRWEQ